MAYAFTLAMTVHLNFYNKSADLSNIDRHEKKMSYWRTYNIHLLMLT